MPPPRISLLSHLRTLNFTPLRSLRSGIPPTPLLKSALPGQYQNNAFKFMLTIAKIWLTFHLTFKYLLQLCPTTGVSMMPTIPHSFNRYPSFILVTPWHRRGRNIKVGDVVTYESPAVPGTFGCKRVVGMPGDYICILTQGKRERDLENRDVRGGEVGEEMMRVPEGHCWLAGDNLEWSRDSRIYGPVPLALIKGKVLCVVTPWRERKWLAGGGLVDAKEGEKVNIISR
ncbi:LexA/Signal peptidase [Lojkania enalia]|uniref:Mitochondrial inner membrane protease subunit n=1 Tax=Lojkania enalia TaxID=147567 RepID=A0A9P4N7U2_9PLEO|nr:LexA/Signal peptidase [Didymosphaeria enalia]